MKESRLTDVKILGECVKFVITFAFIEIKFTIQMTF